MKKQLTRRVFIENTAKGMAATGLMAGGSYSAPGKTDPEQLFIHHVFFWLRKPVTEDIRQKFEKALKQLVKVETIVSYHLGVPAATKREVIDSSYTYSLFTTFKNKEDHDVYQSHPTHLKFIEDCSDLWERVVVYDSVSI
jgi:quinol monooxygenase YgiN